MTRYVILPGYGGSGAEHWQSVWQAQEPAHMHRFAPSSWERPDQADWLAALDRAVAGERCVLVAHSLSCVLAAQWLCLPGRTAAGAFLVAPPDPDGPEFPRADVTGFASVPRRPLGCPALVVASQTDPYATLSWAQARAQDWGAGFINLGAQGHINTAAGFGDWPEGRRLLTAFVAGLGQAA